MPSAMSRNESAHKEKTPHRPQEVRLNRFIANAGICSRREADKLIVNGQIRVNGKKITELGHKVLFSDKVVYKGRQLLPEACQYVLLNKPKGFITTTKDPKDRKTVMSLVEKACTERIYPVGRLDKDTTGLLLFTNDGETAKRIAHPSHRIKKIYRITLNKPLAKPDLEKALAGVELADGTAHVDQLAVIDSDDRVLGIEIHIGRNKIVRRIFDHLGYEVIKLDRVMFGPLTKKNLPRGKFRHLSSKEVMALRGLR